MIVPGLQTYEDGYLRQQAWRAKRHDVSTLGEISRAAKTLAMVRRMFSKGPYDAADGEQYFELVWAGERVEVTVQVGRDSWVSVYDHGRLTWPQREALAELIKEWADADFGAASE